MSKKRSAAAMSFLAAWWRAWSTAMTAGRPVEAVRWTAYTSRPCSGSARRRTTTSRRSAAAIHGATVTPNPLATSVRTVSRPSNSETGAEMPSARHNRSRALLEGSPTGEAIQGSAASARAETSRSWASRCRVGRTATSGSATRW